jgi:alanyl-tRNA synthetase
MKAADIIKTYISFFKKRKHKQIPNASLVPENDPTTLFTSSGMQPLVPYLLGELHPQGKRLVNVQNSFRAQDIEEIGDNRHTTFFRMLGNWSLGEYFKEEQLSWFFTFLTKDLSLDPKKLYVTVFEGSNDIPRDEESATIWSTLFRNVGLDSKNRIHYYGVEKNWWSRSGVPKNMPALEPGGPDSEVFYDFGISHDIKFGKTCHVNCDCGRFLEIGNSVFMQYQKQADGTFKLLPQKNVDFGGGLERLIAVTENQTDIFQTSLFSPIIQSLEQQTQKQYGENSQNMRIVADHMIGSTFIIANNVKPSNTEQGYILRRLLRRGLDAFYALHGKDILPVITGIVTQYNDTDPILSEKFEEIKNTIYEEEQVYMETQTRAKKYIVKQYKGKYTGDELLGQKEISADDAFILYATHGLSPTQIENLGFVFDKKKFTEKMKQHKMLSKTASGGKFKGGLADTQELTIKGHTATHLLQQALRDTLGNHVHQTGSNITVERLRFDFTHPVKLTEEEIQKVENNVREKIEENLPVHFEILPLKKAQALGAIGLFNDKYQHDVKVYFIGGSGKNGDHSAYSKEFCGGPHVSYTGKIKSFTIIKQENIGNGQRRLYAVVS